MLWQLAWQLLARLGFRIDDPIELMELAKTSDAGLGLVGWWLYDQSIRVAASAAHARTTNPALAAHSNGGGAAHLLSPSPSDASVSPPKPLVSLPDPSCTIILRSRHFDVFPIDVSDDWHVFHVAHYRRVALLHITDPPV